jgi:hypothetical protein
VVVGGDAAVVPEQLSGNEDGGRALVRWLTSEPVVSRWSDLDPGYLTLSDQGPYATELGGELPDLDGEALEQRNLRALLTEMIRARESRLRFDLSDQVGALSGGEPSGMSEVLFDWFTRVTEHPDEVGDATQAAIDQLMRVAQGDDPDIDDCGDDD